MNTTHVEASSLRDRLAKAPAERFFCDRAASVCFTKLSRGTSLDASLSDLVDRSVLIATASQLTTALALTELDGRVRRLTILPPDIEANRIDAVIRSAEIDAVVIDAGTLQYEQFHLPFRAVCTPSIPPGTGPPRSPSHGVDAAYVRHEWCAQNRDA